jgi:hypothetical protein
MNMQHEPATNESKRVGIVKITSCIPYMTNVIVIITFMFSPNLHDYNPIGAGALPLVAMVNLLYLPVLVMHFTPVTARVTFVRYG